MEERFSPEQLLRRPKRTLVQWLRRRGVSQPEEIAGKLKELAEDVLRPAPEQTVMLQRTLSKLIKLFRGLEESIQMLDREVAYWLARTPGALLTSIGGLGVTLAAGWTANLVRPANGARWIAFARMRVSCPKASRLAGPKRSLWSVPCSSAATSA